MKQSDFKPGMFVEWTRIPGAVGRLNSTDGHGEWSISYADGWTLRQDREGRLMGRPGPMTNMDGTSNHVAVYCPTCRDNLREVDDTVKVKAATDGARLACPNCNAVYTLALTRVVPEEGTVTKTYKNTPTHQDPGRAYA